VTSQSTLHDKSQKPPGLLPKNVQSWLLAGLAVLMVVIMWLTDGKKSATPLRSVASAPAVQAPLEVNEAKIIELQNRIAELQREQTVAQMLSRKRAVRSPAVLTRGRILVAVQFHWNMPRTPSARSARSATIFRCLPPMSR